MYSQKAGSVISRIKFNVIRIMKTWPMPVAGGLFNWAISEGPKREVTLPLPHLNVINFQFFKIKIFFKKKL